jgi:tRNA(Ile)-lysidine synthase
MLTAQSRQELEQVAGRVIVAYSGGCDSHALLHYLATNLSRAVEAVHINHNLQAESVVWQAHCEQVCDGLNVPLTSISVAVSKTGSLETNARNARYVAFKQCLQPGDYLLLAHHQDDQTETLLMNLFSGRAQTGLLGMPGQRALAYGQLMRPLLQVRKAAILAYARAAGLHWIEDPSNADTTHTRNWLRHELIPQLAQRWPNVHDHLEASWQQSRLMLEQVQRQAEQDYQSVRCGPGMLAVDVLETFSLQRQQACLAAALKSLGYAKTPGAALLAEMCQILLAPEATQAGFDLGSYYLQRYRNYLYISEIYQGDVAPCPAQTGIAFADGVLTADVVKGRGVTLPANQLQCRTRQGGESILVNGHHRKLKQLFQEHAVPPHIRGQLPLLWLDSECIGYCGVAVWGIESLIADPYRATADTHGCEIDWQPPGVKNTA